MTPNKANGRGDSGRGGLERALTTRTAAKLTSDLSRRARLDKLLGPPGGGLAPLSEAPAHHPAVGFALILESLLTDQG